MYDGVKVDTVIVGRGSSHGRHASATVDVESSNVSAQSTYLREHIL